MWGCMCVWGGGRKGRGGGTASLSAQIAPQHTPQVSGQATCIAWAWEVHPPASLPIAHVFVPRPRRASSPNSAATAASSSAHCTGGVVGQCGEGGGAATATPSPAEETVQVSEPVVWIGLASASSSAAPFPACRQPAGSRLNAT